MIHLILTTVLTPEEVHAVHATIKHPAVLYLHRRAIQTQPHALLIHLLRLLMHQLALRMH